MRGDEVDTANRFHDWRGVQWHHDDDGTLVLNARLTPEQGALVRQALKAAVEAVDNASAETSSTGRDSRGQRQADALAAMAEAYLVTGVQPGSGGDRHLVEDERGTPLDVGRKTRSIPPAIRRALQVRDRGCRFPGCTIAASSTATTSATGLLGARPAWPTSPCCAGAITGRCTRVVTASKPPATRTTRALPPSPLRPSLLTIVGALSSDCLPPRQLRSPPGVARSRRPCR